MADMLANVALVMGCLLGLALTALRLPGTWLIVACGLAYGWWADWERVSAVLVAVLAGIALIGEALELLMTVVIARRGGASRRAGWGGLIGGFAGMFLLSFVPIPIIGSMIGALLGCFAGALIGELSARSALDHSARVGFLSMLGFVLGTVAKLAIAFAMAGILLTSVVCAPTGTPASAADASGGLRKAAGTSPETGFESARGLWLAASPFFQRDARGTVPPTGRTFRSCAV